MINRNWTHLPYPSPYDALCHRAAPSSRTSWLCERQWCSRSSSGRRGDRGSGWFLESVVRQDNGDRGFLNNTFPIFFFFLQMRQAKGYKRHPWCMLLKGKNGRLRIWKKEQSTWTRQRNTQNNRRPCLITRLRASTKSLPVCWTRPVSSWDSTVASQPLHSILRAASASPVSFHVVWQRWRSGTSESRGARILFTACGREAGPGGEEKESRMSYCMVNKSINDLHSYLWNWFSSVIKTLYTYFNLQHKNTAKNNNVPIVY